MSKTSQLELPAREALKDQAQGAYLVIAARAFGLACGPMSGFDNTKVDEELFGAGVERQGMLDECVPGTDQVKFPDPASILPPSPRLDYNEACHLF